MSDRPAPPTFRVLVTDKLSPKGLAVLEAEERLEVVNRPGLPPEDLLEAIADADALAIRSGTRVTREVIEAATRLKVVGRAGVGVDNVDREAASERGIVVMNTPGGNTVTTAEHTISLMLSMARNIPRGTATLKAGEWAKKKLTGVEIMGKTLGVVGLGNIGRIVADRAQGLKMKVVGYDPFMTAEAAAALGIELVDLDVLFSRSDVVTVHTPLTDETRGLVDEAAISRMKDGVLIVNCARGGIVDEGALADGLASGKVGGAALDTFVEEPPPADHPLLAFDNVVCTPHLGASTEEATEKVSVQVAEQIRDFLLAGEVRNALNMPSVSAQELGALRPYLTLAERLGALLGQTIEGAPRQVAVEYKGEVTDLNCQALTHAILKGLFGPLLDVTVNDVNAPILARDRGIRVTETKSSQEIAYTNLVQVTLETDARTTRVAGALLGPGHPRLVRFNDFFLEAVLDGPILILHNEDVPGVVGQLGSVLGDAGINIAGLNLGRESAGGQAVSLFHVDEPVPRDVLDVIRAQPHITGATQVVL